MIATTTNNCSALKVLAIEADTEVIVRIRTVFHAPTIFNHGASVEAAREFLQSDFYDLIFLDILAEGNSKMGLILANELAGKQYGGQGHVFFLIKTKLENVLENELITLQHLGQFEMLSLECLDDPLTLGHKRLQCIYQCLNDSACRHKGLPLSHISKTIPKNGDFIGNVLLSFFVITFWLLGLVFTPFLFSHFKLGTLLEIAIASIPALILLFIFRADHLIKLISCLPMLKTK